MKQYRIIEEGKWYVAQKRFLLIFWYRLHIDKDWEFYTKFSDLEEAKDLVKQRKQEENKKVIEYL
tara:strand:+ start:193 stop:387 length:195 start_codon:yes stop_codon:yes gene_type:complete